MRFGLDPHVREARVGEQAVLAARRGAADDAVGVGAEHGARGGDVVAVEEGRVPVLIDDHDAPAGGEGAPRFDQRRAGIAEVLVEALGAVAVEARVGEGQGQRVADHEPDLDPGLGRARAGGGDERLVDVEADGGASGGEERGDLADGGTRAAADVGHRFTRSRREEGVRAVPAGDHVGQALDVIEEGEEAGGGVEGGGRHAAR